MERRAAEPHRARALWRRPLRDIVIEPHEVGWHSRPMHVRAQERAPYSQTWLCANTPIAPIEWAALPKGPARRHATGFDPRTTTLTSEAIQPPGLAVPLYKQRLAFQQGRMQDAQFPA